MSESTTIRWERDDDGVVILTLDDPDQSAKAYARAVALARQAHQPDAALESSYGVSLVAAANGTVNRDAEAAFAEAVRLNPRDVPARFYLGLARAQHRRYRRRDPHARAL